MKTYLIIASIDAAAVILFIIFFRITRRDKQLQEQP